MVSNRVYKAGQAIFKCYMPGMHVCGVLIILSDFNFFDENFKNKNYYSYSTAFLYDTYIHRLHD